MPTPHAQVFAVAPVADTTLVTTAETVVATLPNVNSQGPGAQVVLDGWLQLQVGTATTTITLRIRRNALAGAIVGEGNPEIVAGAAGSTEDHSIQAIDNPGEVAGQAYVLTAQQAAATGNGTAVSAGLQATVTGA